MSDEAKQKMREHHYDCNGANNPATGRHWYNNGITRLFLKDDDIIPEGFIRGNLPKTLEETQRRKASLKGKNSWAKGSSWFNNGIKEIMSFECPIGYVKGRLSKKSNIEIK